MAKNYMRLMEEKERDWLDARVTTAMRWDERDELKAFAEANGTTVSAAARWLIMWALEKACIKEAGGGGGQ